eukprot:CAMPEP_0181290630 /NCGR_PEP_ID=MMETSP1101-20121128/1517_1 /TAXON_ID=46948 /ORGANISM="Rhodomonas abbreviata, Strain Caron Lab Isolate" /LENGTH=95 /DNA_ID=CAMNT_0023394929 /DNA_START=196 /DNA_END=483 /DNA_ORIENTATION=+
MQMLFCIPALRSLAAADAPLQTPGAWDDWTSYNFTNDAAYGDSSYPLGYAELWDDRAWHIDNMSHIRPDTGIPSMNAIGAWTLPGRDLDARKALE